ncbi:MAG TPA: cell division protein FtsL [Acidobacteriota bacterium]|nr:cell division protein FtsL [Acidobacteriota bacterium]
MIDWACGIENRNYGIKRITDPQKLSELLWIIFSLAMVAGVLLFYASIRSQITSMGYSVQQLRAQEDTLVSDQRKLILEEQTLKNPERIEKIARVDLGMTRLRTDQLLMPQYQDVEPLGSNTLALANPSRASAEARKSPITD